MKEYEHETLKKAVIGCCGNMSEVARRLGCAWDTARKIVSDDDELRGLFLSECNSVLDVAESVIYSALTDSEDKKSQIEVAKWLLATKGKRRGFDGNGGNVLERRKSLLERTLDFGNDADFEDF